MLRHLWHGLVTTLTQSTQDPFMHVSWILIACMTVSMTAVAIVRILPSIKARRIRKLVKAQRLMVANSRSRAG